jgi:hypothetical protein
MMESACQAGGMSGRPSAVCGQEHVPCMALSSGQKGTRPAVMGLQSPSGLCQPSTAGKLSPSVKPESV